VGAVGQDFAEAYRKHDPNASFSLGESAFLAVCANGEGDAQNFLFKATPENAKMEGAIPIIVSHNFFLVG
jgi:hypothetical protein